MAKNVIMPALGLAQETGILLKWLKAPGEMVALGEPLMEIETDKATVEIEAPAAGVLAQVTAQPGDEIPVGQVIAVILTAEEASSEETMARGREEAKTTSVTSSPHPLLVSSSPRLLASSPLAARLAAEHNIDLAQIKPDGGRIQKADVLAYLAQKDELHPSSSAPMQLRGFSLHPSRVLASPKARRLATELGLELATIPGSGENGAVLAVDIAAAQERNKQTPVPELEQTELSTFQPSNLPMPSTLQTLTLSKLERIAAERLTQSWTTVPHFYLIREVNAGQLIAWRERALVRATEKISYTDLLVKAVAAALRQHPRLNAAWQDGSLVLNDDINIGLAVAVEDGLLVPVIHQADQFGLNELAARRKVLVAQAQARKLAPADLSGGTFTLSNLGMYGVDAFNAIINPPQVAILAVGRMADRVVPLNGQAAVQPMLTLTLSCDHRSVDGARGAAFLQTLAQFVEDPLTMME